MNKITKTSDMTPGILYCLFTHEVDGRTDEPYDLYGALVYWTGEGLMYEDGGDCQAHWDYAVAQSTTPNADFCIEAA